jgi:hypothetical protein
MYPSSSTYKTAIAAAARTTRITGVLTLAGGATVNLTNADIVQGSLTLSEQCVSGDSLEIGNVYASELCVSLITPAVSPWSLTGAKLALSFGIDVSGLPTWEDIPLGVFWVTDIDRKETYTAVRALDNMILLDVPLGATNVTARTIEQLIVSACAMAGVTLATTHATFEAYPNKAMVLTLPANSEVKTCRDLVMWACQVSGTYARMNRAGQLEVLLLHSASARTITAAERYAPTIVSDVVVQVTGVQEQVLDTLFSTGTNTSMMVLTGNPLLETQTSSAINAALAAILADITQAVYTPFQTDFIGDPTIQAGDYITLSDTGSIGANPVGLVTSSFWRYRDRHSLVSSGQPGIVKTVVDQNGKKITSISADMATLGNLLVTGTLTVGPSTSFASGYDPTTKRRVFTATPTTPYDVGDLWLTSLTAGTGDIKKCISALASGAYNAAHWVIASKYTDDTTVNALAPSGLVEAAKLGTTVITGGYIKSSLLTASNIVTGKMQSVDGTTYFDLNTPEIKQTATVGGKAIVVTVSPTKPFELSINGIKEIYVSSAGVLVMSRYDVNEDGLVDQTDVDLIQTYLTYGTGYLPRMDVNGSGTVTLTDLVQVKAAAMRGAWSQADLQIRSGSVTLNASTWTTVTFSSAMAGTPRIAMIVNTTNSGSIVGKVKNVSSTGFQGLIGGTGTTSAFDWIAIYGGS